MRHLDIEFTAGCLVCPSCQKYAPYSEGYVLTDLPIDNWNHGLIFCGQCEQVFEWCDRCGALKETDDECGCVQPLLHWITEAGMLGRYVVAPRGEYGVSVPSEEPSGLKEDGSFHINLGGTGRRLFVHPQYLRRAS